MRTKSHLTEPLIALQDCVFLALICLLSLLLYINKLGFYSDDWHFLGLLSNSADQSLFGLARAVFPDTRLRPVQTLYVAGPYWLFGLHPLGYHLVNGGVFTIAIVLFYLALRELTESRFLTLALPLLYSLLPNYSTDRFWFIAFVANLTMCLYFLSLYSELRVLRTSRAALLWRLLSACSLVCSGMAYEVTLPLFLLNPLFALYRANIVQESTPVRERVRKVLVWPLVVNILMIGLVATYKVLITRSNASGFVHNFVIDGDYSSHLVRLVAGGVGVNYGSYGIGLPIKIMRALRSYPNLKILSGSVLICVTIFVYLYRSMNRPTIDLPSENSHFKLMGVGLIVFASGYAIFLTNANVAFSTTGVNNRSAISAALGVAITYVGLIGWISWMMPSLRVRKICFCLLAAVMCSGGFLLNNTIAAFWTTASVQQREIMDLVRDQFPTLPRKTTLILDGACPYVGPGIVFECYWDVSGMLRTYFHDPSLRGDIVRRNSHISDVALQTTIYGEKKYYPYSDTLLIFDVSEKTVHTMGNFEVAELYFQTLNPARNACPIGVEGDGVWIF